MLLNSDSNSSFDKSILQSVKDLNFQFSFFDVRKTRPNVKLSELDFLSENRPLKNIN